MKLLRVGVIGLGTIGSRLVEILAKEFRAQARVDFICDRREERIREVRRRWIPRAKALPGK
jgi:predicted dinucleotide-utilizing enzyme